MHFYCLLLILFTVFYSFRAFIMSLISAFFTLMFVSFWFCCYLSFAFVIDGSYNSTIRFNVNDFLHTYSILTLLNPVIFSITALDYISFNALISICICTKTSAIAHPLSTTASNRACPFSHSIFDKERCKC